MNREIETVSPQGLDLQERVIEINRVAKVVRAAGASRSPPCSRGR
jgi:hypothetical protein